MPKDYSKLLRELKPMLPSGYQATIDESIEDVKLWQIKAAFSGRPVTLTSLKKIYKKAAALARKEQKQLLKANAEVREIKKSRRQSA